MTKEHRNWQEIFEDLRKTVASNKDEKNLLNLRAVIGLFIELDESMAMHEVIDKFEEYVYENIQYFEELRKVLIWIEKGGTRKRVEGGPPCGIENEAKRQQKKLQTFDRQSLIHNVNKKKGRLEMNRPMGWGTMKIRWVRLRYK